MATSTSRLGSNLTTLRPDTQRIPAPVKDGDSLGANTIAGLNDSSGDVEVYNASNSYNGFVVVLDEIEGDGGVPEQGQSLARKAILRVASAEADPTWASHGLVPAYLTGDAEVSNTDDGGSNPECGLIVEVDEDADMLYVLVQ
jgi:hypothetical protein